MEKSFYTEYFAIEDKHWWFVGRRRLLLRVIGRLMRGRASGARILDVGCGTGTMLQHLSKFGEVQGADADEEAVRFCQMRGAGKVTQLRGNSLPFADGSRDLITMFDVLEHIEDDSLALREAHRVLRDDGSLVLTVPAHQFLWGAQDEISHHYRRYGSRELRARLEGCGFRVDKMSHFNALFFPAIAAIRLLRRPFLKKRGDTKLRSDFTMTKPGKLNQILSFFFSLESLLIDKVNFPFGVSILAVGKKTAVGQGSSVCKNASRVAASNQ